MHLGANRNASSLMQEPLGESNLKKELGVLVDHRLGNGMQCLAAACKAGRILPCINKGIYSRDKTKSATLKDSGLAASWLCHPVLITSPKQGCAGASPNKSKKANKPTGGPQ